MKRILSILILALLAGGAAQAQDNWFGLRSGYPLGVTLHYGIDDGLSAGTDLRINGRIYVRGADAVVGVGVDALRTVSVEDPFVVYVGGGPAIEIGSDVFLDVHGLAGAEFRLTDVDLPELGVFVEGALGATIALSGGTSRVPDFGAAVGFNWHF